MQHLLDRYDKLQIHDVPLLGIEQCLSREGGFHGHTYNDFVGFPQNHGYEIDEHYRLIAAPGPKPPACRHNNRSFDPDQFLQSWLFFGLLRCLVRKPEPIMKNQALFTESPSRLNTRGLADLLGQWNIHLRDLHVRSSVLGEIRCIEAIQILSLARRVVIANLAEGKAPLVEDDGRDIQALCLMILGETLSATLVHIMKSRQIDIRGWKMDEDGWGPPKFVAKRMKGQGWCPRSQKILKGQLRRSATLLYVALMFSHPGTLGKQHQNCDESKCTFVEAYEQDTSDGPRSYKPMAYSSCSLGHDLEGDTKRCRMIGPNAQEIVKILETSRNFPLLRISGQGEQVDVEVGEWSESSPKEYATISHVWAHGMGNKNRPEIWHCQLRLIQRLLNKAFNTDEQTPTTDPSPWFWLDTLAIPTGENEVRRKAIKLIYLIFNKAKHTIIIDRHLLPNVSVEDRSIVGVRLLASGWMKRLWNLQEAYVTDALELATDGFREDGGSLRNIDILLHPERARGESADVMKDSFAEMVQLKLSQNLMGPEREARKAKSNGVSGQSSTSRGKLKSLLIASAWRSATYRDVGRLENETLALASLLNLEIPEKPRKEATNDAKKLAQVVIRDRLMAEFWKSVSDDARLKFAIPSGMIFTPGERINVSGFGWAPRTWMSGMDEAYPYPLSIPKYTATLKDEGIVVQYPGFMIRSSNKRTQDILRNEPSSFEFSVGVGLYDWYKAEPIKSDTRPPEYLIQDLLSRVQDEQPLQLAILLSRPQPTEFPPEVGLLVEIYEQKPDEIFEKSASAQQPNSLQDHDRSYVDPRDIFMCRIIRRLEISRVPVVKDRTGSLVSGTQVLDRYSAFDASIIGEIIDEHQQWCVDSYQDSMTDSSDDDEQYYSAPESAEVDETDTSQSLAPKDVIVQSPDITAKPQGGIREPREGYETAPQVDIARRRDVMSRAREPLYPAGAGSSERSDDPDAQLPNTAVGPPSPQSHIRLKRTHLLVAARFPGSFFGYRGFS